MSTIHNIRSSHFKSDTREAIANVELRGALARGSERDAALPPHSNEINRGAHRSQG